jgi:HAE1 family hydrophobic/amphiphilic exporter-1/multidrug efflux pump
MQEISKLVDDSIPAKVSLVVTSPGFGSSSVNSGFVRLSKKNLVKESCLKKKLQIN